ncbi:MAG: hypothetical protein ACE366_19725 [Bradymonadia bacterium]
MRCPSTKALTDRASVLACSALLGAAVGITPLSGAEGRVQWTTPGSYRLRTVNIGELPLDEQGTETGQRSYGTHRLRIDPTLDAGNFEFRIQMDVLTGQIFGDTQPVGAEYVERRSGDPENNTSGWTTVEPRLLWLEWRLPWLEVRLGQMGFAWGMGVLYADGHDEPEGDARWVERFGDRWNGDLVQRAQVSVAPLSWLTYGPWGDVQLSFGADQVYQDEEASWLDGDRGYHLFGALMYPGEEWTSGVYVTRRFQDDADGDRLDLWSVDVYARWLAPLYPINAELKIQGELIYLDGSTDRFQPASRTGEVDIDGLGWVARAEIAWRCPRLALGLEMGYASGDSDADDDEIRQARFDPDYRVGFILFQDALRLISLRSAERLADLERVGVAAPGDEHLPTDGAVHNAFYIFPGVTWRPGAWTLTGATLLSWAAERLVDPVATFDAGGTPRNHLGQASERFYGVEFDGAVSYALSVPDVGTVSLGAQGGVLLPGAALEGAVAPDSLWKAMGRLDIRW